MENPKPCLYEFGPFRLDADERRLSRDGQEVALAPKLFETLAALVERSGHVLNKGELMQQVWPDSFVEESSLSQNISLLRKVLGEGGPAPKFIETIPKRGYRFVAPVRVVPRPADDSRRDSPEAPHVVDRVESAGEGEVGDTRVVPRARPRQANGEPRGRARRKYALLIGVAALLAVGGGLYAWGARTKGTGARQTASKVRSLAVVPFKPLGDASNDEILGLGMADALIIKLGNADAFTVLPTSAVTMFTGREHDAREIGRRLGVEAVLDGTVQRAGERVRVTATLIDLRDDRMLWSGKFDEQFTDIFALQDSLSERVSAALEMQFSDARGGPPDKRFTRNAEAYELYLMGIYFWNKRTPDGMSKAAEYLRRAVEKDPNYALAYAALSDTYALIGYYGYEVMPAAEAYAKAKAAGATALALDGALPEAYVAAGMVEACVERDFQEADRMYRRAIELNPNSATARLRYAGLLIEGARLDEAIEQMSRAHSLDPLSPTVNTNLSAYYVYAGRPDEAISYARRALEVDPAFWRARVNLGDAYELKGMFAEAEAEYRKLFEQEGARTRGAQQLAHLYASTGRQTEAREMLRRIHEVERAGDDAGAIGAGVAPIYVALGETEAAFEWLGRAANARALTLYDLKYGRSFDPLRTDPRFTALQERVAADR
jgi:DNA-binding winged helix-turn-helix (wHTH) protein/TolB-like protein/Tfp pilus assembly protein PilF